MSLDKLQAASYKGVSFLIDGSNELEGGRKGVVHEYVNQDEDMFEDTGRRPDVFSVTGIVHGADFLDRADRLRRALNAKGGGILTHPFWGDQNVINETYSVSTSTQTIGLATFNMTFRVARTDQIVPVDTFNNSALIGSLSTAALSQLQTEMADIWSTVGISGLSVADGVSKLSDVLTVFENVSDTVYPSVSNLSEFFASVNDLKDNQVSSVLSGVLLSTGIFNILGRYRSLAGDALDQFNIIKRLFDFGDGEATVPLTTTSRIQRQNNRDTMNQTMQLASLVEAYGNIPSMDFKTDIQLKEIQETLDIQYDKVAGSDSRFSTQALEQVKELRSEVRKFLDSEISNVFRVTEVQTQSTPMTILGYQYYGNTDEVDNLIDLNAIQDVTNVDGTVKVFTQ